MKSLGPVGCCSIYAIGCVLLLAQMAAAAAAEPAGSIVITLPADHPIQVDDAVPPAEDVAVGDLARAIKNLFPFAEQ